MHPGNVVGVDEDEPNDAPVDEDPRPPRSVGDAYVRGMSAAQLKGASEALRRVSDLTGSSRIAELIGRSQVAQARTATDIVNKAGLKNFKTMQDTLREISTAQGLARTALPDDTLASIKAMENQWRDAVNMAGPLVPMDDLASVNAMKEMLRDVSRAHTLGSASIIDASGSAALMAVRDSFADIARMTQVAAPTGSLGAVASIKAMQTHMQEIFGAATMAQSIAAMMAEQLAGIDTVAAAAKAAQMPQLDLLAEALATNPVLGLQDVPESARAFKELHSVLDGLDIAPLVDYVRANDPEAPLPDLGLPDIEGLDLDDADYMALYVQCWAYAYTFCWLAYGVLMFPVVWQILAIMFPVAVHPTAMKASIVVRQKFEHIREANRDID